MKRLALLAAFSALAGCMLYPAPSSTAIYACANDSDCAVGFSCALLLDAGAHCVPAGNVGNDAGADAGSDAGNGSDGGLDAGGGGDAGTDAGLWPTDAGLAMVAVVQVSGGPVLSLVGLDSGINQGLELVLGTSLWTASGGVANAAWSEAAANALYDAVMGSGGGSTSFHIEQITAAEGAWFAAVSQQPLQADPTNPEVIYATTNAGVSWSPIATLPNVGIIAALNDHTTPGPVLYAQFTADAGMTALELLRIDGGVLGLVPPFDLNKYWGDIASFVPYPSGGMLIGHYDTAGNLDVIALDGGEILTIPEITIPPTGAFTLFHRQLGPLLVTPGTESTAGEPTIYFPAMDPSGDDNVWSIRSSQVATSFLSFGDAGSQNILFATGAGGLLWFADGDAFQTVPEANLMAIHGGQNARGPLSSIGSFGPGMWGVDNFGIEVLSPPFVDAGPPVPADAAFFGQSMSNYLSIPGGQVAMGGSNPSAPLIYVDTGAGFAAPLTNLAYEGCTAIAPLNSQNVLVRCATGVYLTWPDAGPSAGNNAGNVLLTAARGGMSVAPRTGETGLTRLYVLDETTNTVSAYTLTLNPPSATSNSLSGIFGPVFSSHGGMSPSRSYAYDSNGDLVELELDGGVKQIGPLPRDAGMMGNIDPIGLSDLDLVGYSGTGQPQTLQECHIDGGLSCLPLCTLPTAAVEFRFSIETGDLWAITYPGNPALADIPTVGSSRLYHVTAAERLLAGKITPVPSCPEVTLQWSSKERPEGFNAFGVSAGSVYLSGSRHTLSVTPE